MMTLSAEDLLTLYRLLWQQQQTLMDLHKELLILRSKLQAIEKNGIPEYVGTDTAKP